MKSGPIILCIFLFVAVTETQSDCIPTEDLQDEYYTVIDLTTTGKPPPSIFRDAQAAVDSNYDDKVMASIFTYRNKTRRARINNEILTKDLGYTFYNHPTSSDLEKRKVYVVSRKYLPSATGVTFTDFLYSLVMDENLVLTGFLNNFFKEKSEKLITIAMVLTKNMKNMVTEYNTWILTKCSFNGSVRSQNGLFKSMLGVWAADSREPLEKEDPTADDIKQNAGTLKKEQDDGGWHKTRTQLELILMKKSIKFSRLVLQEFEKLNNGTPIEDILTNNVKTFGLDDKLAEAYATLARYIKNKHNCIARILGPQCDGSVSLHAWVLSIAVVHPQEWPKIDEAFKKDQKGVSLSKFITEKITDNKVLAEAMAVVVDPTFKPTLFSERPPDDKPL